MSVLAKIRWLRPDEGGRDVLPRSGKYSTVARFEVQTEEEWRQNAWSLVLSLEGSADQNRVQAALVRFLANEADAPTQWLQPQSRFSLFEGHKKVAEGTVIEAGD